MKAILFRIVRTRGAGALVRAVFGHMSFLVPVDRLYETNSLMAFHHPQPDYPLHILIVPKRGIRDLSEIRTEDQDFLHDLFECVRALIAELKLEGPGYRLIANGGQYQEIPLLHFHLISESWAPESR